MHTLWGITMIHIEEFAEQLSILHRDMQTFAEQYPEQARLLNLKELNDKDPHVERLLEGVAFMNALIQRRMDADLPEISQTLLEQFNPQLIRPLPSMTIMQASPRFGQVQKLSVIPKGTVFSSHQVGDEETSCHFSLTDDLVLNPIYMDSIKVDDHADAGMTITLNIKIESGIKLNSCQFNPLRFYINAESALSKILLMSLISPKNEVSITYPEFPSVRPIIVAKPAIKLQSINHDNLLLPNGGADHLAYRWLHEVFNYQDKYSFIEIAGINANDIPDFCQIFSINIRLDKKIPAKFSIKKEHFQLHCVPAINLYDMASEPVTVDHRKTEYDLIADVRAKDSVKMYKVVSVTALNTKTGERENVGELTSFSHNENLYYQAKSQYHAEGHVASKIMIEGLSLDKYRLSCSLQAFNGDYPRQYLRAGDININKTLFNFANFKNITRPTAVKMPPQKKGYYWQLIQHLRLNLSSIDHVETLKELLKLYVWNDQIEIINQINSIKAIEINALERIRKGGLRFGTHVKLKIDESKLSSELEAYWVGYLLHQFFSLQALINNFVMTELTFVKSDKVIFWEL